MFSCCSTVQQDKKITDKIKYCSLHSKPMLFVCKNVRTCMNQALFCTDCADGHKGHDWETVNNFFTSELTKLITHYPLRPQEKIDDIFAQIHADIARFKANTEKKLQEIQQNFKKYEVDLKAKYPSLSKATGNRQRRQIDSLRNFDVIDNQKMSAIMKIYEQQKNSEWMDDLYSDFLKVLKPTENRVNNVLQKFSLLITGYSWDDQEKRKNNFDQFLDKSLSIGNVDFDPLYFKFSQKISSEFVNIQEDGVSICYCNDNFAKSVKPGGILSMPFTKQNNSVTFSIKNLQKTAFFFDSSQIFVGVCLPKLARQHDYGNFQKHSHSLVMISSKGKAIQNTASDFKQLNSGLNFGANDEITVTIDFSEPRAHFMKKGTVRNSTFSSSLTVDKKNIKKLRGFVSFQGEKGAKVAVLPVQQNYKSKVKRYD